MNILISDYFNKTQLIRCNNGHEFPYDMLDTLKKFKMRCPDCMEEEKAGTCEVTVSSEEIREKLRTFEKKRLNKITFSEFLILDYLYNFNKVVSINKISTTLDKSEATVKLHINKLIEKDLVQQDFDASKSLKKEVYGLSGKGRKLVNELLKYLKDEVEKQEKKHS